MTSNHVLPPGRRLGAAATLAVLVSLAMPTAAMAHVRVLPDQTTSGSFSALTFRVPNESATAGTVKLTVELPQDQPFLYVSAKPVPGWRVDRSEAELPTPVESEGATITKAVRTVTWTADRGRQIGPGEYQEFSLSVGPLPAPGSVLLPAAQTYSDGTVVRWDEPIPAGGQEPEHPAPVLEVTAAEREGEQVAPAGAPAAPPAATTDTSDVPARVLGGAGLLVGLAGLASAALSRRRLSRLTGRGA